MNRVVASASVLVFAAAVQAQFTARVVPVIRWGTSPGSVGLANATLEDFEDLALAPGLSVSWTSPAGTVGPLTTLNRAFAPATGDPFGTAFANGAWLGLRGLVSALDNQTYSYSASQFWGDLELRFDPPVSAVGFSMQQADLEVNLIVNGAAVGGLASLTGASMNGQRNGYFVVQGQGSSTISSLRLDNTGGDGFVIDQLLYTTQPAPVVDVVGTPLPWARLDGQVGITPQATEDFEDVTLTGGLSVGWETPTVSVTPSPTLPATFNGTTDDAFGTAFVNCAWDGTRFVVNTRTNDSFAYSGTNEWGDIIFRFSPPRRAVGFSLAQAESPARLLVNGRDAGELFARASLPNGPGRHGYVRIAVPCGGAPITEVRINNTRTDSGGDGIGFDHLMMGVPLSFTANPEPVNLCSLSSVSMTAQPFAATPAPAQDWQIQLIGPPGNWANLTSGAPFNAGRYTVTPTISGNTVSFAASPGITPNLAIAPLPALIRSRITDSCDTIVSPPASLFVALADLGSQGGLSQPDGQYDNNDFIVYIDLFFASSPAADVGGQGGVFGPDGLFNNNDFIVFIDKFFAGC